MKFNNSAIQEFLTCNAKFRHSYLRKMFPRKKQDFFVFGEALHRFKEVFYRTQDGKLALKQVGDIFEKVDKGLLNREETHSLMVDLQTALGIATAYPLFYKQDFDEYDKFLTEQKFCFKLENGHEYFGTIDCLLKDHAGDWWIGETKTAAASTINDDYFERVKIDSQVSGYMHGGKSILGFFPRGVIYDVIKKPSIRLKMGESLSAFQKRVFQEYTQFAKEKEYFQRQQLMVATHRLDEWLRDVNHITTLMATKIQNKDKTWIKNTGACRAYFGTCPYMTACIQGDYNTLLYEKQEERS